MSVFDEHFRRNDEPAGTGSGDDAAPFRPRIIRENMANIEPEPVTWLWPGRIPAGKLTLLVGDPGLGKSFLTLDVAARLSSRTPWPDRPDEPIEPGTVILLSAEDDPADTIRPRLDAAGADCTRIEIVKAVERSKPGEVGYFNLELDLRVLEESIKSTSARLLVIDPVSAYLGKKDSHSNADIRGLLAPLADVAARHKCAVLAVTHMNKNAAGRAMYRAMGSLAFCAAARMAWLVTKDRGDPLRRLLLPIKANIIEEPVGMAYSIVDGVVQWSGDPVTVTADEALSWQSDCPRQDAAEMWLMAQLALGPRNATDVRDAAIADGHSWRTVQRAKDSLGVEVVKSGFDKGWVWRLPKDATD